MIRNFTCDVITHSLRHAFECPVCSTQGRCSKPQLAAKMMSLAARSGAFSPYMQATAFTVAGPLKALVPGVVVKTEKILLNPKKQFLCRESLNGQSPKTGPSVTVSINGECVVGS